MTFLSLRGYRWLLVLLILATLALIDWQRVGMNLTLPILGPDAPQYNVYSVDDSSNGGSTLSFLETDKSTTTLVCELFPENQTYSFCEIAISVMQQGKGLDLSKFDSVTVELGFKNSPDAKVRVQMKNPNPVYSLPGDPTSEKFNIIEFNPTADGHRQTIPLSYFQVPEWWVSQYNVPIRYSQPEFTNITVIEVSVGTNTPPGEYELWVKELTLTGKVLSYTQLLTVILAVWITLAVLILLSLIVRMNSAFHQKQKQVQELNTLNRKLNTHSQRMELQAKTDALTGLLNRNGVAKRLLELKMGVQRNSEECSVIFCDIDFFKHVNDTYGHGVGDQVITQFADLLQTRTRTNDLVVRWGGEEFVLFCPQTSLNAAAVLAENLRQSIESAAWSENLNLTASFGVSQMQKNEDIETFLNRADMALYRAKERGRNRVEINEF